MQVLFCLDRFNFFSLGGGRVFNANCRLLDVPSYPGKFSQTCFMVVILDTLHCIFHLIFRGVLLGILGIGVPPCFPNHDPILDQKVLFSPPVFRPGLQAEIMLSLLRTERKQTNKFFKSISSLHISVSFVVIWNWNDKYECSSLENHTRFQTKMGKVYTRFQTKTAQRPYPMGRHIPLQLI